MYGPSDTPELPAEIASEWQIVEYITGANALFGTQNLGLGDRCYYGFLARALSEPDKFIAVVRGTECRVEWLEDCGAALIPGPSGLVHAGFQSIYLSMRIGDKRAADVIAAYPGIKSLTVIGHSLGSALATYLMADIRARSPAFTVEGALFASPKPGDANFAHWVDSVMGRDNYAVFNFIRDVVPRLPIGGPFGLGFQALPGQIWLTPSMAPEVHIPDGLAGWHSALTYAAILSNSTSGATQ
jgi:hypothetical protein